MELKPFPDEVLAVAIGIGGIPVGAPELPGAVQDLEPLLIRAGKSNKNVSNTPHSFHLRFVVVIVENAYSAFPYPTLIPIRPKPTAGISGPSLPSRRVRTVFGDVMVLLLLLIIILFNC